MAWWPLNQSQRVTCNALYITRIAPACGTARKADGSLTHPSQTGSGSRTVHLIPAILTHYAIYHIGTYNMPVPESEVLKPREPSLAEASWAEFVLRDASVVHERNGKPANLLLAYPDTPLKVQGRLEAPSREHSHHGTLHTACLCDHY